MSRRRGFTLVEFVIVIAIMAMVAAAGVISYRAVERRLRLAADVQKLVTTLQAARDQTTSSRGRTSYGVHFETTRYVLFSGTTYSSSAPTNEVHNLASGVQISAISLGGASDVTFSRITGLAQSTGTVTLQLVQYPTVTAIMRVSSAALPGSPGTVNPTGTARHTDSRDIHFDLGWSIQNATTLQLTFSNPPGANVVQNISIPTYMSGGKFDWTGTVTVGGENQTLHIYTLSFDAFDTTLAIRRDRRYNTKALVVTVDGKQIVSYAVDANGTATVGPWGGTMTPQ